MRLCSTRVKCAHHLEICDHIPSLPQSYLRALDPDNQANILSVQRQIDINTLCKGK